MKMHRVAIVAFLGLGATAAAADVLVVRATGPSARSFPAGKKLADSARVTLAANDQLIVLDARGTRTLRGPGTFTPGGPATAGAATMASATQRPRARIGAVRSVGASSTAARPSRNVRQISIAKSSNVCVDDPRLLSLWRPDASRATSLTVSGGGTSRTIDWAAGQNSVAWPADLAVKDGTNYRVSWTGSAQPTMLTVKTLPPFPGDLSAIASSLIQHGCTGQLDTLIETARVPEDRAAPQG